MQSLFVNLKREFNMMLNNKILTDSIIITRLFICKCIFIIKFYFNKKYENKPFKYTLKF